MVALIVPTKSDTMTALEKAIRVGSQGAAIFAEEQRRRAARQRRELLHDNFLDMITDEINAVFEIPKIAERMRKHATESINLFAAIHEKISLVYSYGVSRRLGEEGSEEDRQLQLLIRECRLDARMALANLYTNALNEVVLRPVVRRGRLCLDILTPDQITAIPDPDDPCSPIAIMVYRYPDPSSDRPRAEVDIWTDDECNTYAADYLAASLQWTAAPGARRQSDLEEGTSWATHLGLRPLETRPNPYRSLDHFVWLHARESIDTLWDTTRGDDLIAATRTLGLQAAQLRRIGKDCAERLIAFNGSLDDLPDEQVMDACSILAAAGGGGSFNVLDTATSPDHLIKQMRTTIALVSARYGVPDALLWLELAQLKGADLDALRRPLLEVRSKQIREVYEPAEHRLKDAIGMVTRAHHPSLKLATSPLDDYRVRFARAPFAGSLKELLEVAQLEISMGVGSPVDLIQELHPDLDREEALDEMERFVEDRASLADMLRATNTAGDGTAPAMTPEENGALGPAARDGTAPAPQGPGAPPPKTRQQRAAAAEMD